MKKLSLMVVTLMLLSACGSREESSKEVKESDSNTEITTDTEVETESVEEVKESEFPFPNAQPTGEATILISTPGGDSAEGNIPVLFVEEDDSMIQIGIEYENFDGSIKTFVYINEIFNTKEQVGERSQSVLALSEDNLKPGNYTVTAVQFEGNNPANPPINYTQAAFKIE